ncbi:MAG TPA: response regulator [Burkholderiaceae bacterium]|nr:response regulator [Burkholderiaceae bacterium]
MTFPSSAPSALPATTDATTAPLVVVVDDDLSMREALSSLIRSAGLRVETWASAAEFLDRIQDSQRPVEGPACLVLDVRMPGMTGLELQQHLAERGAAGRPWPIVFITGHGDIPMTVRAMRAGAIEFLPKPFSDQELLAAIDLALAQARAAQHDAAARQSVQARFDTLTPREREVLLLMVQGLRNKLTADRLGISEVTVKVHRHHVMEKMRASSLPMLVDMVDRLGLRGGAGGG